MFSEKRRISISFLLVVVVVVVVVHMHLATSSPLPLWLAPEIRPQSAKLAEVLQRVGPNIRASTDYHDYQDLRANESIEAWRLLHEQVQLFAKRQVGFHGPQIRQLVRDANVSRACQQSISTTLEAMERLESWAVQMWSYTGNLPPVALLNGHFTDLGSYRGCVDLKLPASSMANVSSTSYCSLTFRPVMPKRPPFHMIIKKIRELVELFENNTNDVFHDLALRAQYFHYMYLKTGACVPHQCSSVDIQLVSKVIGARLGLMTGPVKCFTRASPTGIQLPVHYGTIENEPVQVELEAPIGRSQQVALCLVGGFFGLVLVATLWHSFELIFSGNNCLNQDEDSKEDEKVSQVVVNPSKQEKNPIKRFAFQYLSIITNAGEFMETSVRPIEIKCLHGLRVLTMIWIIVVHTLQYNEWSGFFRVFENEATLQNPFLHPIYNANYTVDNFFFMSGLLAAYTTWYASKNPGFSFRPVANIVGRYLRLTPQVLLIALLYMLLPLAGDSPFWYDISAHASWTCQKNWWISLLHIQSFYKSEEMCNLVSWWISVDMFYYVLSVGLVYLILSNRRNLGLLATGLFVGFCISQQVYRHYIGGFTPNNLGVVPQIGEVWTNYVIYFFWSPYPHAYSFFLGLWTGYLLATWTKMRLYVRRWSRLGWFVTIASMLLVNMSSHIWMSGRVELGSQVTSTAYNLICTVVWSTAFGWMVVACHHGTGQWFNNLLSIKPFLLLSKASFIIYLSHMLIVRMYFGLQNGLLEVSIITMTYTLLGNIFLSIVFGVFLCIVFEGPCLKFQKLAIQAIKTTKQTPLHLSRQMSVASSTLNGRDEKKTIETTTNDHQLQKVLIKMGSASNTLLK